MIPNLKPLIEPLTTRFAAAWAKAKAPHDDGEFNERVCAVLHYEHGLTNVGRNGKRGDPNNLSKDVINWKGEGPNPDPVNGGVGTIIDFIVSHEAPNARIDQFYPDPNGPGAWVKPLTLEEIDQGIKRPTPAPAPPQARIPTYESLGGDAFFREHLGKTLVEDMAPRPLDEGSSVWFSRAIYDIVAARLADPQADVKPILKKYRNTWREILGKPPLP
jgi:hypothetical protein